MPTKNKTSSLRLLATSIALLAFCNIAAAQQTEPDNETRANKSEPGDRPDQPGQQKPSQQKKAKPNYSTGLKPIATWTDAATATREHPGFKHVGEYTKGDQAIQVSITGDQYYLSVFRGGLPGAGWDGQSAFTAN